jgi:hypothetical protein
MPQIAISQLTSTLTGLSEDVDRLSASQKSLCECLQKYQRMYDQLSGLATVLIGLVRSGAPQSQLLQATQKMQEMQMSFNLQYLMLQNKISQENRQFSMLSNIMKNKHDTAKNSINNIR